MHSTMKKGCVQQLFATASSNVGLVFARDALGKIFLFLKAGVVLEYTTPQMGGYKKGSLSFSSCFLLVTQVIYVSNKEHQQDLAL